MALPDNYRRANELVGRYMNTWAIVEMGLVDVISAAFFVHGMFGSVIGLNTTVREKVAIARTGVRMSIMPDHWKEMADHALLRVSDASVDRNMIAHTLFDAPDDSDGAIFLHRTARSGLKHENVHWTVKKFDEAFAALFSLRRHLDDIQADLRDIPEDLIRDILRDGKNTKMPPMKPTRLSVELPPPQGEAPTDQPKPKPRRERKQEQREKELQQLRIQNAELKAALARYETR